MSDRTQKPRRFNLLAVVVPLAIVVVVGGGLLLLKTFESGRFRARAIADAKAAIAKGENDVALEHIQQYLRTEPNDIEALKLKADLLSKHSTNIETLGEAAEAYRRIVASEPESAFEDRRKLVTLYVRVSDLIISSYQFRSAPELFRGEVKYGPAEAIARRLVEENPESAADHRLLGMTLDGQGRIGDPNAAAQAIAEYQRALELDPGDLEAAGRLLQARALAGDEEGARLILDELLAAKPEDPEVRLLRYGYYSGRRELERAAEEIAAAIQVAPERPEVRLAAAQNALDRGDPADARRQLDEIPEASKDDLRIQMMRGLVSFAERRPEEGIEQWRQGLLATKGTSADLTWSLAYLQLREGKAIEAAPLVEQYLRISGDQEDPRYLLLQGMLAQAEGDPTAAIAVLEPARDRAAGPIRERFSLALGAAYDAAGDRAKALEMYRQAAATTERGSPTATLGLVQELAKDDPDAAVTELKAAIDRMPNELDLRLALAEMTFRKQAALPAEGRDWAEFDRALAEATRLAPKSAQIALFKAGRLRAEGRTEEITNLLADASEANPRDARIWTARASHLGGEGRLDEALAALDEASAPEKVGDALSLRLIRAQVLLNLGRGREARAALGNDLKGLDPADRAIALRTVGQLAAGQGDVEAAKAAYRAWASLRPSDPQPLLSLLDLALTRGDSKAIEPLLAALQKLGAENPAYLSAKTLILLDGGTNREDEAAAVVAKLAEVAPDLPITHHLQGRVADRAGAVDEAVAQYRQAWKAGVTAALPALAKLLARADRYEELSALQSEVQNLQLGGLLTNVALIAGDDDRAAGYLNQAATAAAGAGAAANGSNPRTAAVLQSMGRPEEAEAALKAVVNADPKSADSWLALVRHQSQVGHGDDALKTATAAREALGAEADGLFEARLQFILRDWPATEKALDDALATTPDDPELLRASATYYEETRQYERAVASLRQAVELEPDDRGTARRLALALVKLVPDDPEIWDQAWALIAPDRPDAGPDTPEDRLARAIVLMASPEPGRRPDGTKILEGLLADLAPNHPVAFATREVYARALVQDGRSDRAVEIMAVASRAGATPEAIALYSEALIRAGEYAQAESQLDRLRLINPLDGREIGLRVGLVRERAGAERAPAALVQLVEAEGTSSRAEALARAALPSLLGMGARGLDAAERIVKPLTKRDPSLSWMPAEVAVRRGRYDEALDLLEGSTAGAKAADVDQAARVLMLIGSAPDIQPAMLTRVVSAFGELLATRPDSADLLFRFAILQHMLGQYAEEVRLYRQCLEHLPRGGPLLDAVLNNLGWALSEGLDQPAEGLKAIDQVIARHPRQSQYLDTRGVVLTRLGQHDRAIADLQAAIADSPSPIRSFHLAMAYKAAGKADQAAAAFAQAKAAGLTLPMADLTEKDAVAEALK